MTAMGRVEQLTETACVRLLGSVRVGRVALTRHALPVVLPASFALDGSSVVLRTLPDSVLAQSRDGVVVAFEAGELDPDTGSGWSVLVTGTMQKIVEASAIHRVRQLRGTSWARDDHHQFIRITPGLVSGNRVAHRSDQVEARPALA